MKNLTFAIIMACMMPVLAHAATRDQQRAEIQKVEGDVLEKLYRIEPGIQAEVESAAGYAVFTSADLAALFISGSYGHGVAHNNSTGQDTYMQMASLGLGLGVGVKDFRIVFVFYTPEAYQAFINTGLDLSGNIDVAAQKGTRGASLTGAQDVLKNTRVYQLTDSGLMAQVMLKGTKYFRDNELNETDKPQ